jgi:hypothetical protein
MEKFKTTLAEKYLALDFSEKNTIGLTEQRTLRILIGILGVLLPVLLYSSCVDTDIRSMESLSHYYFTRANSIFTITVSLLAVFLLIYKPRPGGFLFIRPPHFCTLPGAVPTDNLSAVCCDQDKPYSVTLLPGVRSVRVPVFFCSRFLTTWPSCLFHFH